MTEHVESSKDFSIDRYQLELEAEGISDLILHYGKQAAKWGAKEKEEKRKLEVIHAACAAFIREDPKSYGLKKDTDAVVLKIAMDEPDYRDQHKIWLETFQLKEEYESAVRALLQKGSMIKELVKLWLNDYYSHPVVSRKEVRPLKQGQESLLNRLRKVPANADANADAE